MARKISMIDLAGIGNLLEYLVAADNITCEERDRIILRIAKEMILLNIRSPLSLAMARVRVRYWKVLHGERTRYHRTRSKMRVIFLLPRLLEHIVRMLQDM